MALTKLELQQMLREMNVKFKADESYDELNRRLQQEHHNLWLKSVSNGRTASGGTGKKVIRKRKKAPVPLLSRTSALPPLPTESLDSPGSIMPVINRSFVLPSMSHTSPEASSTRDSSGSAM